MKKMINLVVFVFSFFSLQAQENLSAKDEKQIINKVVDISIEKYRYPKYVFIGEQVLSDIDQYLTGRDTENRSDSLSLLIDGKWSYLKQVHSDPYSTGWKRFSPSKPVGDKIVRTENTDKGDMRFSPVRFSPDGNRAFVIYSRTLKNIPRATVFFFFEKRNGTWVYKGHYLPWLE